MLTAHGVSKLRSKAWSLGLKVNVYSASCIPQITIEKPTPANLGAILLKEHLLRTFSESILEAGAHH